MFIHNASLHRSYLSKLYKKKMIWSGHLATHSSEISAAGAGLTGTKMARRIGNIEEFEFKAVEGTYNQGVSSF